MKRILILISFVVFFISCNKVEFESITMSFEVLSTDHSGCLGKSAMKSEEAEKLIVSYIDENNYKIEHQNITFNCCLPEGIEVNVYRSNDTIYYSDKEKVAGNCKCLCDYNTLAEFGGIVNGDYILCLKTGEIIKGLLKLKFDENMFEEHIVSDLIVN